MWDGSIAKIVEESQSLEGSNPFWLHDDLKSSEGRPRPESAKVAYAPTICDPGADS